MFGWFFVTRGCHQSREIRVTKVEGFGPSSFQHHHSCPDPMERRLWHSRSPCCRICTSGIMTSITQKSVSLKNSHVITPNSLQYKNASSDPINLQFLLQKSLH